MSSTFSPSSTHAPSDSHDTQDSHATTDSHNDSHDTQTIDNHSITNANTYNIQNGTNDAVVSNLTGLIARQNESMERMSANMATQMRETMGGVMSMMESMSRSLIGMMSYRMTGIMG